MNTRKQKAAAGIGSALIGAVLLLSACGSPESSGRDGAVGVGGNRGSLSIATGGTGAVYYPLGGGIATLIRQNVEGYDATVQETNASVDNMRLIDNGSAQLAFGVGDVVSDAVKGAGQFEGNPISICSLGNTYNSFTQAITVDGTGIASVEDMAGKVVSVGAPGSATEVAALRVLEAAGINPETDVERRQLGAAEVIAALRDGTVDAAFYSSGLPTGALIDLASDGDMKLLPIAKYAEEMAGKYGKYYVAADIPAGTYEGQTEAVPSIASPNLLVALANMDEQLQYEITKAVFDNKEALTRVHPAARELDAATADDTPYVDICPGAQTYFKGK